MTSHGCTCLRRRRNSARRRSLCEKNISVVHGYFHVPLVNQAGAEQCDLTTQVPLVNQAVFAQGVLTTQVSFVNQAVAEQGNLATRVP